MGWSPPYHLAFPSPPLSFHPLACVCLSSRQVLDSAPQPDRFHLPRYSILPPACLALFSIRPEHFELAITAVYDRRKTLPAPDWGNLSGTLNLRLRDGAEPIKLHTLRR